MQEGRKEGRKRAAPLRRSELVVLFMRFVFVRVIRTSLSYRPKKQPDDEPIAHHAKTKRFRLLLVSPKRP